MNSLMPSLPDLETLRLLQHRVRDLLVVEPPVAVVGVGLERGPSELLHLVLELLELSRVVDRRDRRIRRRVDHDLRQTSLRAGELVDQVAGLRHLLRAQRKPARQSADHGDVGLAVDEHLLDEVQLAENARVVKAALRVTKAEEAEDKSREILRVRVMRLHVDDEELVLVE